MDNRYFKYFDELVKNNISCKTDGNSLEILRELEPEEETIKQQLYESIFNS